MNEKGRRNLEKNKGEEKLNKERVRLTKNDKKVGHQSQRGIPGKTLKSDAGRGRRGGKNVEGDGNRHEEKEQARRKVADVKRVPEVEKRGTKKKKEEPIKHQYRNLKQ